MIERGEKLEEYREIKAYWICRLMKWRYLNERLHVIEEPVTMAEAQAVIDEDGISYAESLFFQKFDAVCVSYGYTKRRMTFECKGITIGRGRKEWGAPDNDVFIIKLGKRI